MYDIMKMLNRLIYEQYYFISGNTREIHLAIIIPDKEAKGKRQEENEVNKAKRKDSIINCESEAKYFTMNDRKRCEETRKSTDKKEEDDVRNNVIYNSTVSEENCMNQLNQSKYNNNQSENSLQHEHNKSAQSDHTTLTEHPKTQHNKMDSEAKLIYMCEFCSYETRHQGMYKRHMEVHAPSKEGFTCAVCGHQSIYRREHKRHVQRHHGFVCDICDKTYTRRHDRDQHYSIKHKG